MLHKDVLKLLMPLEMGPISESDQAVEGIQLDNAQLRADVLLKEMFANSANELLSDWERVCGITPTSGAPVQLRQAMVIRKLRELGDIKAPYFVALAASLGFTITIEHLTPFMAGWSHAGDTLYSGEAWWQWKITVLNTPTYLFLAGQSTAGELLSWWPPAASLESVFNELKPADVYIQFVYN